MLFGFQLRHARAVARWTEEELAQKAAVAVETITGMESVNGPLPETDELERIVGAMEDADISFIESGLSWAGDPADWGARIRAARAFLGWTLEELAQKAGVPIEELGAIEGLNS